jgi:hypothetical protein
MMTMIQSTREAPISLTNNSAAITFTSDTVRTRSCNNCNGWLCHQQGSPLYQILDGGYYEVDFNANVSSATPGVVALGLYQDGILVPGTTVASTITAAGDVENVKFTKIIKVCCRANASLTVASVPSVPDFTDLTAPGVDTQTPIIANANLVIEKLS